MQLLSWNVQWCRGVDGRVDARRIAREIARIAPEADVICLQEVARGFDTLPGSGGEDQFALLAAALPAFTAVEGIALDLAHPAGGRRQFGNVILSRLPVFQVWRHALPQPADAQHADMARIALEAAIDAPGLGALRVTCTHLAYYSALQRAAQVQALRERHEAAQADRAAPAQRERGHPLFEWQARPAPALVAGDFNCEPGSDAYARMAAPPFADAWTLAHPGAPHPMTAGCFDTVQWERPLACDFVFVSHELAPRVVGCEVDAVSAASDHQSVLVTLR